MNSDIRKKISESLLYKLFELENRDKSRKINRIKQDYLKQIDKLKDERDAIIKKAVSLLEKRKIKELEGKL